MPPVIDSHAHVFPDRFQKVTPSSGRAPVDRLRRRARGLMRPFSRSLHRTQTWLRLLPSGIRRPLDGLTSLAPMVNLLVESTLPDLREAMLEAGVDYATVIAHPPWIPNEFILEIAAEDPRLLPVAHIPASAKNPKETLRTLSKRGARALKIHPVADGEGPDSARYRELLTVAADQGLPVILHTGCLHSPLLYKDPEQGHAEKYRPWFEKYSGLRFVLAHMNFHEPSVAIDLAEKYENLFVETSWQPAEMIGEAARRLGAGRVLFGSDWPFVGDNIAVGVDRVRDCVQTGTLTESESAAILGLNSAALLGVRETRAG